MAWATGHTHEATMTLAAFANAVSSFTLLLTEADFNAADHGALADAFAASPIEAEVAIDSSGTAKLSIDVLGVDTVANTFILRVGTMTTSTMADTLYWRYGSTSVSNTATAAYDSNWMGYWPLQNDANDRTSNGENGTASGGVTIGGVTGKFGNATDFDGTDDYVGIPSSTTLDALTGNATIISWASVDTAANQSAIFYKGSGPDISLEHRDGPGTVDDGYRCITKTGGYDIAKPGVSRVAAGWYHVAGQIKINATVKVYENATEVASVATFGSIDSHSSDPAAIGAWDSGATVSRYFDGKLQDVQVHSTNRSAAWIANEYDQTSATGLHSTAAFTTIGGGTNRRRRFFMGAAA